MLFNERLTTGEGAVRTADNTKRDYAEFLKRWDERLGRELTDAELAQRRHVANMGTAHHPPSDFEMQMESRRENARIEAAQRDRQRIEREASQKAAADLAHRKEIAERQAQFILSCDLSDDLDRRMQ